MPVKSNTGTVQDESTPMNRCLCRLLMNENTSRPSREAMRPEDAGWGAEIDQSTLLPSPLSPTPSPCGGGLLDAYQCQRKDFSLLRQKDRLPQIAAVYFNLCRRENAPMAAIVIPPLFPEPHHLPFLTPPPPPIKSGKTSPGKLQMLRPNRVRCTYVFSAGLL